MVDRAAVLEAVFAAVDQANEALSSTDRIARHEDERILGDGSTLDSLGFVSLVVAVEGEVQRRFGASPLLTEAIGDPDIPVGTLGDLADLVLERARGA